MKEKIIELFELAGYEFICRKFNNGSEFYHVESEETEVFFQGMHSKDLKNAMEFINQKCFQRGKSAGRIEVQFEIKKLLGL